MNSEAVPFEQLLDRRAFSTDEPEVLYIDMDGAIADFKGGINAMYDKHNTAYIDTSDFNVKNYEIKN